MLIRTNLSCGGFLISHFFAGDFTFTKIGEGFAEVSWKDKFLSPGLKEIGCYLVYDISGRGRYYFLENKIATKKRVLVIKDVKRIFSKNIVKELKELKLEGPLGIIL